jgi:hypothetical protein
MRCCWLRFLGYLRCRRRVLPTSSASTKNLPTRAAAADHHADRAAGVVGAVVAAAAAVEHRDRFGLGWRPELAVGILAHLHRVDLIEVIADDYFEASRSVLRALRTLAAPVSVVLHGVSLGLASTQPIERRRLERIARLIDNTGAGAWSRQSIWRQRHALRGVHGCQTFGRPPPSRRDTAKRSYLRKGLQSPLIFPAGRDTRDHSCGRAQRVPGASMTTTSCRKVHPRCKVHWESRPVRPQAQAAAA